MTLAVFKATRPGQVSNLVKREDPEMSRERFTLLGGVGADRKVEIGTPLGKITNGGAVAAAVAAIAGNTGNGVVNLANPAFANNPKLGVYTVTCTTPGADGASKFRVEDPDGVVVGTATGGAAFNKAVKFTIAGGGTPFVEGDSFAITLSQASGANDGKVVAWDPNAGDGSQKIWGFSLRAVTAAQGVDNDSEGVAARRLSLLYDGAIVWPNGITAAQKAAAVTDADERLKIVIRT